MVKREVARTKNKQRQWKEHGHFVLDAAACLHITRAAVLDQTCSLGCAYAVGGVLSDIIIDRGVFDLIHRSPPKASGGMPIVYSSREIWKVKIVPYACCCMITAVVRTSNKVNKCVFRRSDS